MQLRQSTVVLSVVLIALLAPCASEALEDHIVFSSNRSGSWDIYIMAADGTGITNLTQDPAADCVPSWSPDGSRIAFRSFRDGQWDIFVMNVDGTDVTNITNDAADDHQPAWSPDSRRLAFASRRNGSWDIWIANHDGSDAWNLTKTPEPDKFPSWSPDGLAIAYSALRGDWDVWTSSLTGFRNVWTAGTANDIEPTWSPDGKRIAFASNRTGDYNIHTIDLNTAAIDNRSRLPGDERRPRWSNTWNRDSDTIVFSWQIGSSWYILTMPPSGGTKTWVTTLGGVRDQHPDWSPSSGGPQATVLVRPRTIQLGDLFSLDVEVEAVVDLAGFQLSVDWGPLSFLLAAQTSIEPGAFFLSGELWRSFDRGAPVVTSAVTDMRAVRIAIGGVTGSGVLVTIPFLTFAKGWTTVTPYKVLLSDSNGRPIRTRMVPGRITVVDGDDWDVNLDGIVDVLDLVIVAQGGYRSDVNDDGVTNTTDLVTVATHVGEHTSFSAPARSHELALGERRLLEDWLQRTRRDDDGSNLYRRGIAVLEQALRADLPTETALLNNYPNPFNPETWIPYRLAEGGDVSIRIFDVRGSLIRVLDLGYQHPGEYTDRRQAAYWDARNLVGQPAASGLYFYQMQVGAYQDSGTMVVQK